MKTMAVGPFEDVESWVTGGVAAAVAIVLLEVLNRHAQRQPELVNGILAAIDIEGARLQRSL